MTSIDGFIARWRDLTVGFVLPDRAFGAAVDIDGLLDEPELHFAATATTSRLMVMPRAGTFTRLLLEWENLPEIGVYTAGSFGGSPFDDSESARLETWMRDVAALLHESRDSIRATAERAVRDASRGLDASLPETVAPQTHVVSAHIGTRVDAPPSGDRIGIVDVTGPVGGDQDPGRSGPRSSHAPSTDEMLFVVRATGRTVGRRITHRLGDDVTAVELVPFDPAVTTDDLTTWYEQHIDREVLFDDVWQVCAHLVAGLEAPANVTYFG